jgi:hypothetical protein
LNVGDVWCKGQNRNIHTKMLKNKTCDYSSTQDSIIDIRLKKEMTCSMWNCKGQESVL